MPNNRGRVVLRLVAVLLGALVMAGCGALGGGGDGGTLATGLGEGATIEVVNQGRADICALSIVAEGGTLEGSVLPEGARIVPDSTSVLEVAPGTYDLRAESCQGDFQEAYGLTAASGEGESTIWAVALRR